MKWLVKYRIKHLDDAWFNRYHYTYSTLKIEAPSAKKAVIKGRPKYNHGTKCLSVRRVS